ncbi:MAG: hypothetical protein ACI4U5_00925 [Bacilli bacterium]
MNKILIITLLFLMSIFTSHIDVKNNVRKAITEGIYIYQEDIREKDLSSFIVYIQKDVEYENKNYREISDFNLLITYKEQIIIVEYYYTVNYFFLVKQKIEVYFNDH